MNATGFSSLWPAKGPEITAGSGLKPAPDKLEAPESFRKLLDDSMKSATDSETAGPDQAQSGQAELAGPHPEKEADGKESTSEPAPLQGQATEPEAVNTPALPGHERDPGTIGALVLEKVKVGISPDTRAEKQPEAQPPTAGNDTGVLRSGARQSPAQYAATVGTKPVTINQPENPVQSSLRTLQSGSPVISGLSGAPVHPGIRDTEIPQKTGWFLPEQHPDGRNKTTVSRETSGKPLLTQMVVSANSSLTESGNTPQRPVRVDRGKSGDLAGNPEELPGIPAKSGAESATHLKPVHQFSEYKPDLNLILRNADESRHTEARGRSQESFLSGVPSPGSRSFIRQPQELTAPLPQVRQQIDAAILRARVFVQENGIAEITTRLYPKELGRISIHISVSEGRLRGRIQTDNEMVLASLQERVPELMKEFSSNGLDMADLELTSGQERNNSDTDRKHTATPTESAAKAGMGPGVQVSRGGLYA